MPDRHRQSAAAAQAARQRADRDLKPRATTDDHNLVPSTMPQRPLLSRQEALRRRRVRDGWILVAVGLLIPFLALWGAVHGWGVREDSPRMGWSLLVAGVAVFTVRMALWLA
jgi:hypothetical protein